MDAPDDQAGDEHPGKDRALIFAKPGKFRVASLLVRHPAGPQITDHTVHGDGTDWIIELSLSRDREHHQHATHATDKGRFA
jgi:hypothetical protein